MTHSQPLATLDFQDFRDRLVSHYAQMALNLATLEHARWRVLEMQQDQSGIWDGLGILVKQRIEELKGVKNESVSDN
jgi:hypothetical protein